MTTDEPIAPELGARDVIVGVGRTVNGSPLLLTPLAYTTTFPVVAPVGTFVAMLVELHDVTVATVPLKLTVPLP